MKKIITVSRQFGSGGRSIAKEVARMLGYKYYDEELVKQVAQETGFAEKFVAEQGEYAPGKSGLSYAFSTPGMPGVMNGLSASDFLWNSQRDFILKVAEEDPCVIVGRCADAILSDRTDTLNVFIHADDNYRADRIVRLYGETDKSPYKRLEEKDKRRKVNYNHFTGRKWGDARNYDIALDSSKLGERNCAAIIVSLAKNL